MLSNAIPTLHLQKGNTLIDYEELLSEKPSTKNKRGSSGNLMLNSCHWIYSNLFMPLGLKNLQLAREKRNIKREKMKKIAESRRFQSSSSKESTDDNLSMDYELERDYFMGNREETELEKFLISMRLANKLNDGKTSLKHPSSIRNATIFPLLNSIQHMDMLVNTNPAFWDSKRSLMFIKYCIPLKSIAIKQLQAQLIDGETICNLTSKSDLIDYLKLDENSATILSSKLEQLRKETILRYMS